MTTQAQARQQASITSRIAALPNLSMDALWALWDEHFRDRPGHHHRLWLESRLAYKIQEQTFGGLKPATRRKLEKIGETGILPSRLQRDANQLLPGTVLTRIYDDVEHRVTICGVRSFEYHGQRFKSLSAVARAITGTNWSGPAFFGLKASGHTKGAT
ncbi:MAG: DUF2924 domain-containing protein [Castellaniella sp.]|uniref:DUF2924 domain-containing protein n=1 Tax=Castellaniella sp. TaxID=1955812 RepID=UPI003A895101